MRKLNNKGVTLIELLVSFSVAAIIIVSMFNVVLSYQREASLETVKSEIVTYKNTVTKTIQNDIIKGNLRSVKLDVNSNSNYSEYIFTFKFNNKLNGTDIDSKVLKIVASNTGENYIEYPDINLREQVQDVRYSLLDLAKGCLKKDDSESCIMQQNILKFSSISTNINAGENTLDEGLNSNNNQKEENGTTYNIARYFKLDIAMSHPDLGGDYHVYIVAPLNYPYCKPTD